MLGENDQQQQQQQTPPTGGEQQQRQEQRQEERSRENMVPQSAMDRATGEKWEAIRKAEAAEARARAAEAALAEMRTPPRREEQQQQEQRGEQQQRQEQRAEKPLSREELQRLVSAEAAVQQFNARCNESVAEGKKAHEDFETVVLRDLANQSPVYDPASQRPVLPQSLVEAALETGEAHEVLYALGKDTENAARIMRLPPVRQAVEIAKFHDKLVAARGTTSGSDTDDAGGNEEEDASAVSRAPPPPRTRASGAHAPRPAFDIMDTSKSSTGDWIAKREAELAAKRQSGATRRR